MSGPGGLARWLGRATGRFVAPTPEAAEWERYARRHRGGTELGDEWNRPDVIGLEAAADRVVAALEERVFGPFLGHPAAVLEIGAGGGRFTAMLAARASRVIAADVAPTMLARLRRRFRGSSNVETLRLDGAGLGSVPDSSVDGVFSYDVFVHLPVWEIHLYLTEIARVLEPGGRAVIHHANTLSELGWRRFLRDVDRVRLGQPPSARFTPMTPELMRELAGRAGLKVEDIVTGVVKRDAILLARRPG